MALSAAGVDVEFIGDDSGVQYMLHKADTAFNSVALVTFLTTEVQPYLQQRAKSRFANEGDDVVGRWVPLRDATQSIREAGRNQGLWTVGDDHPINVRTHEMENYVTSGQGNVFPVGIGGATMQYPRPSGKKSIRDKMRTAQKGGMAPNSGHQTVPRPVIGLNEQDLMFVLTALSYHFARAV